jgi:hypothetical protein
VPERVFEFSPSLARLRRRFSRLRSSWDRAVQGKFPSFPVFGSGQYPKREKGTFRFFSLPQAFE